MVRLIQVMFSYRKVLEDIAWATMVLLPKGGGGTETIFIVEVLWKVCSVVVNCWLKSSVVLHDALHGFRERRGAGTSNLEANLAHHLVGLAHKTLFQFFLDVRKPYESMDMELCLELLRGY